MKILKKNQVVIFVIALMLITAGYLNYISINKQDEFTSAEDMQFAGIGDAKLVSSNSIESLNEEESSVLENEENKLKNEEIISKEEIEDNTNSVIETSSNSKNDEYFTKSRLERDKMFSQMIESYEKILENVNIASDQKSIAQTEVKRINDLKNAIMICENLIKTKGFDDVIIFVNDISISVIVKDENLEAEKIAQIQNIIAREMKANIENIHISNK